MAIELFHIGEVLVAEILSRLQERDALGQVRDIREGISFLDDLHKSGVELPAIFLPDLASLAARSDKKVYSCDGEQTVDVLCTSRNGRAVALEVKLGLTRMGRSDFRERFCTDCGTSHSDQRLSGSMVAILERTGVILQGTGLIASYTPKDGEPQEWTVAPRWWLVVRRRVWKSWKGNAPIQNGRVALLEDLAETYGSSAEFDKLVKELVGSDFAKSWKIFESDNGRP